MHDLNAYHAAETPQPTWSPSLLPNQPGRRNRGQFSRHAWLPALASPYVIAEDVLLPSECQDLIAKFDQQQAYPVGVDGYTDSTLGVGSWRVQAWAPQIAEQLKNAFWLLPDELEASDGELHDPEQVFPHFGAPMTLPPRLGRLGSTPWLRFMRYVGGGQHVPHYDSAFINEPERYITLFSWVLYLNDIPTSDGGGFQFIDDGQRDPPRGRGKSAFEDWMRMAEPREVLDTIQPVAGRMLIFPHWLCHQVQAFTGAGARYIIRGDLAYGMR